jgi:hypothetical protein
MGGLTTIISECSNMRHSLCLLAEPFRRFPKLKETERRLVILQKIPEVNFFLSGRAVANSGIPVCYIH